MLVRGDDVAQIGTVEYVFEGRQNLYPDMWSIVGGDEATGKINMTICITNNG